MCGKQIKHFLSFPSIHLYFLIIVLKYKILHNNLKHMYSTHSFPAHEVDENINLLEPRSSGFQTRALVLNNRNHS